MAAKKSTKKSASPARTGRATKTSSKKEEVKKTSPKNTKKTEKKVTKPVAKKNNKTSEGRGGANREMDELTGFAVGTESQTIAETLLEGGESRQEIIDTLRNTLDTETRNGTEKPVANLVSSVVNKLLARGFTIESSFKLVEPTPASKRAAAKRAKELESQPKRGPGRPPRNPAPAKGKGKTKGKKTTKK